MISRLSETILLRPANLQSLRDDFEIVGVFNPGAVRVNDKTVLLVRVAEKPRERRSGWLGLPRWDAHGELATDWVPEQDWTATDARVVRRNCDGMLRLTSVSNLRVLHGSVNDWKNWTPGAVFFPTLPMEEFGVEDPRIVEMEGRFWITFVGVSRHGAMTSLASTDDMETFDRHGVIFCPENKDVVLFPQKIGGEYLALHRPNPHSHFRPPEIWFSRSPDLLHWGRHGVLFSGALESESDRVGAGAPPLLLDEGWLLIYHGSRRSRQAGEVGAYVAGALLLDRDDPTRILRRSHSPIMEPTADFERFGFVNNVVFPTAVIAQDDSLVVYYGAADTCVGVVEFSRGELLSALS
ncbi:glycoside hydrolase family 130 protein [Lignipirellula cremea]|uniref:Beta-1,4-mannooligosaccharide phosphorylase n=1 Tax=Lignipirellula cremea TaxID=2528010 RepID=A0A518E4E8_9BACT|nr:glycoside hydrolase family 130 protein [Lignipirellula cremea]QDU98943.1 Beta-1,4-mannooligosaccharide phosphorylase [Lignipirellula cremea]